MSDITAQAAKYGDSDNSLFLKMATLFQGGAGLATFRLTFTPETVTIPASESRQITVTLTQLTGASRPADMSVVGVLAGVNASFDIDPETDGGVAVLTLENTTEGELTLASLIITGTTASHSFSRSSFGVVELTGIAAAITVNSTPINESLTPINEIERLSFDPGGLESVMVDIPTLTQLNISENTALNNSAIDIEQSTAIDNLNVHTTGITSFALDFPALDTLNCADCPSLTAVDISGVPLLESIDLSDSFALVNCDLSDAAELVTVNMDGSTLLQSLVIDDCPSLGSLSIFNCPAINNISADNGNLSSGLIDGLLAALAAGAVSNGAASFTGNAIPGAPGLAAKATLEGRGWTVAVDS